MKPIHKFNNGNGAMLCNTCRTIISVGKPTNALLCDKCHNERILVLEESYRNIFKKESIPLCLIVESNKILKEWKELMNWKEDKSYPLTSILYSTDILDEIPSYQEKEEEIFRLVKK
jgi:hypothetical protein